MYYYIVDPQKLPQREFERVQNQLYSSVSEYRVAGEVVRSTGLRTINQLVENAFAHEAKTVVAVGSDETLNDVINAVAGRDMVIGFIPIVDSEIGDYLGLKGIAQAAKTLGGRRIAELDLGKINGNLFLSKLAFGLSAPRTGLGIFDFKTLQNLFRSPSFEIRFAADEQYHGHLKVTGGLIQNRGTNGNLDILLLPKLGKWQIIKFRREIQSGKFEKIPGSSIIHIRRLEINIPEGLPLRAGSRIIAKTPVTIEVVPKGLKIIVGKDRKF